MNKHISVLVLLLVSLSVFVVGCQTQNAPSDCEGNSCGVASSGAGAQSFNTLFGTGNAKCTVTNGTTMVTWWLKGQDYKLQVENNGANLVSAVKKGDMMYMTNPASSKCVSYNLNEIMTLINQSQTQQQNPGSTVDAYKGYNFVCTQNVVTDADIIAMSNCEDMTETLKTSYQQSQQAMQQLCSQCQQNPSMFGGDCSQYCK